MRSLRFSLTFLVVSLICSLIFLIFMAMGFSGEPHAVSEALKNSDPHVALYFVIGVVCMLNNVVLISVYLVIFSISNRYKKGESDS